MSPARSRRATLPRVRAPLRCAARVGAGSRGVDAARALADNDAYAFFAAEGGLLRTGPTGTNVMDLVLIEVQSREPS